MSDAGRHLVLDRVEALIDADIPVVLCTPNSGYRTNGRADVAPPRSWQLAQPDRTVLDQYRPGHHTLAMVTGHGIDVVDLDHKTGVRLEQMPISHALGLDLTPGGGWHIPVSGTGYARAALRLRGRVVGDFLGGVEGGAARGLCYLPGSNRPKYPGLDYTAQVEWDIDKILGGDPDPILLGILDSSGISRTPRSPSHGGQPGDIAAFLDAHQSQADCRYGSSALAGLMAESAGLIEGGRHAWAVRATARVVELIQAGCLDLRALTALQDRLRAVKPETTDGEYTDLVQWAIANTEASTDCTGHLPTDAPLGPEPSRTGADWNVIDLAQVLANPTRPTPDLMTRTDGVSLIYPGLVHSISGESESFKSGLMLWEAATLVNSGAQVLYIDFESDAHSVVERLLGMGADPAHLAVGFHYIRPHSGFKQEHFDIIPEHDYRLIVVDGVTEALSLSGGDTNSADSVARLYQQLPHQLAAKFAAAVVLIDHVSKSRESRGRFSIGSQHKLAAISGAAYIVEPDTALARGARGTLNLKVAKDRPGVVRQQCGAFNQNDRTQAASRVVVDSTGDYTIITHEPPTFALSHHLVAQVSGWLGRQDRPVASAEIEAVFRNQPTRAVVAALVDGGFVEVVPGHLTRYRHLKHFIVGIDTI